MACEVSEHSPSPPAEPLAFGFLEFGQVWVAGVGGKCLGALSLHDCGSPGAHPVASSSRGPFSDLSRGLQGQTRPGKAPSFGSVLMMHGNRFYWGPQLSWLGRAITSHGLTGPAGGLCWGRNTEKVIYTEALMMPGTEHPLVPTCPSGPCPGFSGDELWAGVLSKLTPGPVLTGHRTPRGSRGTAPTKGSTPWGHLPKRLFSLSCRDP